MPRIISIKRRKYEMFLKMVGCSLKRIKGDHFIYTRPGLKRPVVITADKEVPILHIKTNLKTLGMSTEEFINILKQL